MKLSSFTFSLLFFSSTILKAGFEEPVFTKYFVGQRLDTVNDSTRLYFTLPDSGAVLATFVLSSDTDWEECRNVSAILDVCTDQNPLTNQSVVTYNGRKMTEYARYLWELGKGEHFMDLVFKPKKSSPVAKFIKIESIKIAVVPPNDPYYWPCALCPYVNTYKDYSQNDLPLLVYYEEWLEGATKRYLYSIVFSHDDGHSDDFQDWEQMKTLDRASSIDIEWMYDVTIDVSNDSMIFLKKFYQGPSHATAYYRDAMRHNHPELSVCTVNNNFTPGIDKGKFPQFLPPVKLTTDLYGFLHPYIEKHPEIYTTWVKEMRRDHGMHYFNCKNDIALWTFYNGYKHDPEGFTNTDPVYHLYFEYELANNSGMAFTISVKVGNDAKWYGRNVLNDNGRHWQSIVLPEETIRLENLDTLRISGQGKTGASTEFRIARIWYFDDNINMISHHVNFPVMHKITAENPVLKYAVRDLFSNELCLQKCSLHVSENMIEFIMPFTGDVNENGSATLDLKTFSQEAHAAYPMNKENGFFSLQLAKPLFSAVYDIVIHGTDPDGVGGYAPQSMQDVDFTKWTGVEKSTLLPGPFLLNNYPNPFNNTTTIRFAVPQTSHVILEIYNSIGQLVERLCDGTFNAGVHHVAWNADRHGCGIYYGKLITEENALFSKLLYLK